MKNISRKLSDNICEMQNDVEEQTASSPPTEAGSILNGYAYYGFLNEFQE